MGRPSTPAAASTGQAPACGPTPGPGAPGARAAWAPTARSRRCSSCCAGFQPKSMPALTPASCRPGAGPARGTGPARGSLVGVGRELPGQVQLIGTEIQQPVAAQAEQDDLLLA